MLFDRSCSDHGYFIVACEEFGVPFGRVESIIDVRCEAEGFSSEGAAGVDSDSVGCRDKNIVRVAGVSADLCRGDFVASVVFAYGVLCRDVPLGEGAEASVR